MLVSVHAPITSTCTSTCNFQSGYGVQVVMRNVRGVSLLVALTVCGCGTMTRKQKIATAAAVGASLVGESLSKDDNLRQQPRPVVP
jgi:hypothetical protein